MRDEHQRLLFRIAPARRLRHQPLDARIGRVHGERLGAQRRCHAGPSIAASAAPDASARRTRSILSRSAIALAWRRASDGGLDGDAAAQLGGRGDARSECRRAAASRQCRRDASRSCTAGSGVPCGEARLDAHVLRKILRPQQLQQPKEPVRVVFERRGAEQQHVTARGRNRRDRTPGGFTGMSRRTPQALRFIHHEQVDAGLDGLLGQLRAARSASRAKSPCGDAARTG